MNMLLALSPFLAFFMGIRHATPLMGLVAAMAVSLLLVLRGRQRGESVKVLEAGTLLLFGLLLLATLLFRPPWTVATVRLAVDAGLFAIALASLALGKPFTLQYARERVAPALWDTPRFGRVNRHITAAWTLAFACMVLADAAAAFVPAIPVAIDVAATVVALAAAVVFTSRYPAYAAGRAGAAAGSGPV